MRNKFRWICFGAVVCVFVFWLAPSLMLKLLPIYAAGNFYIGLRVWQAFSKWRIVRRVLAAGVAMLSVSFFAAVAVRLIFGFSGTATWLWVCGAAWLMTMPYWVTAICFWDLLRLADRFFGIFPRWVAENRGAAGPLAAVLTFAVVAGIFARGYYVFSNPVTREVVVQIGKDAGGLRELRAVVASDWHFGEIVRRDRVRSWVNKVNALGADIILLPGDLIDRDLELVRRQGSGEELARLRAPLGVWAVLGNHEVYTGADACAEFLREYGVQVLQDEAVEVAGAFWLAGREDAAVPRKGLDELLKNVDRTRPVILLNHRPERLAELERAGVDLQLSGHTHGGQLWPATWIVRGLNEVARGYGRLGKAQIYVTTGLGLWGLPVRIGSESELVNLRVLFGGEDTTAKSEG